MKRGGGGGSGGWWRVRILPKASQKMTTWGELCCVALPCLSVVVCCLVSLSKHLYVRVVMYIYTADH